MDGDSVQNTPLTFIPPVRIAQIWHSAAFQALKFAGDEGAAPGSELGELRAFSLWWEISLLHGQSPAEEVKCKCETGRVPNYSSSGKVL